MLILEIIIIAILTIILYTCVNAYYKSIFDSKYPLISNINIIVKLPGIISVLLFYAFIVTTHYNSAQLVGSGEIQIEPSYIIDSQQDTVGVDYYFQCTR